MISAYDVRTTIYEIPLVFAEQKVDEIIIKQAGARGARARRATAGSRSSTTSRTPSGRPAIAIVGKYTGLHDSYISIFESLFHGGIANGARVQLVKFESEELEDGRDLDAAFADCDGILVPGGFGLRGIEGMIRAARYAREKKVPYLGICLGHADHGDRVFAHRTSG